MNIHKLFAATSFIFLPIAIMAMQDPKLPDNASPVSKPEYFIISADASSKNATSNSRPQQRLQGEVIQFEDDFFSYNLFSDDMEAEISSPWYYDNDHANKIAPNGILSFPSTVTHEGKTYTVTCVSGFNDRLNDGTGSSIIKIELPASLKKINGNSFAGTSVSEIDLPETLECIDPGVFARCPIKNVKLPDALTYIGDYAFADNPALTEVRVGSKLGGIGVRTFANCPNLSSFIVDPANPYIKVDGYYLVSIDGNEIVSNWKKGRQIINDIPERIEVIREGVFTGDPDIVSFKCPESLKCLDRRALADCISMTELIFNNKIESIMEGALVGVGLKELRIPEQITTFRSSLSGSPNLERIYIGKNLENLGGDQSWNSGWHAVGSGCPNLKEYVVDPENKWWVFENGALYNKSKTTLCHAVDGSSETIDYISPSVVLISGGVFSFPESKKIILPPNLWGLTGPAFQNQPLSAPLDIPWTTDYFDGNFMRDLTLKDIYYHSNTPPVITENFWEGVEAGIRVHVPAGSGDAFRNAPYWCDYEIIDDLEPQTKNRINFGYIGNRNTKQDMGICTPPSEAAFKISKETLKAYKGCTITAVEHRNAFAYDMYAFIYKASSGECLAFQNLFPAELGHRNHIRFDTPYVITGEEDDDLLIGVGIRDTGNYWYSQFRHPEGNYFRELPDGEWTKGFCGGYGALDITCSIEGTTLPRDARILSVETDRTVTEGVCRVKAVVQNTSTVPLSALTLDYSFTPAAKSSAGTKAPARVQAVSGETEHNIYISPGITTEIEFEIPAPSSIGDYTFDLHVAKIDGVEDIIRDIDNGTANVLVQRQSAFNRKVVMEEGTGTWCGYCPEGMATILRMKEKYPDNFIAVAIHDDDDMPVRGNYAGILNSHFPALPLAALNRKFDHVFTPSVSETEKAISADLNIAIGEISALANFTSSNRTSIDVSTETILGEDATGTYSIACAVVENNVGPFWQNAYGTPEDFGLDCDFSRMIYNDVARELYYANEGSPESAITCTMPMEVLSHRITIPVPANVVNTDNIELVAMLINNSTGEIENADCVTVGAPAGISAPDTDVAGWPAEVYTLQGVKVLSDADRSDLETLAPGVYILRHLNTTTKFVKK